MVDHLSCLEFNALNFREREIFVSFSDEYVMAISNDVLPWYVNFANYIVYGIIPKGLKPYQNKKFLCDDKKYYWDELY